MQIDLSLTLAQIMGRLLLVVSTGLLIHRSTITKIVKDLKSNLAMLYIASFLRFMIGLVIISLHNVWEPDWTIIVTVFGWVATIFGAAGLLAPELMLKTMTKWDSAHKNYNIPLGVMLVLSLILLYFGYGF